MRQETAYKMEKVFANYTSDRRFISRYYKELKILDIRKPDNAVKTGT